MADLTNNTNNTTAEGIRRAQEIYRSDWDGDTVVALYMPHEVVENLLTARGWRRSEGVRSRRQWISPTGYRTWEIDVALKFALTAEALAPTA